MWINKHTTPNRIFEKLSDFPEITHGFVYLITVKLSEEKSVHYIGKKNLRNVKKKLLTIDKLPNDKRKRNYEYVKKESDWLTYNSSCKELKYIIGSKKFISIEKQILKLSKNDRELSYQEARQIMIHNALVDTNFLNSGFSFKCIGKLKF